MTYIRADYVWNKTVTHRQYYGQFVNQKIIDLVAGVFGEEELTKAFEEDNNFNNIPLQTWDRIGNIIHTASLNDEMFKAKDYVTKSGLVCILKEAAKQIVEQSK